MELHLLILIKYHTVKQFRERGREKGGGSEKGGREGTKNKKAQAFSIARKCCQFVKGQRLNAVYTDGPDV